MDTRTRNKEELIDLATKKQDWNKMAVQGGLWTERLPRCCYGTLSSVDCWEATSTRSGHRSLAPSRCEWKRRSCTFTKISNSTLESSLGVFGVLKGKSLWSPNHGI